MIDGVLLVGNDQSFVCPHALNVLSLIVQLLDALADFCCIAFGVYPLECAAVYVGVVLKAPGLHQLDPFVEDGRLQPAGILAEALP